MPFFQSKRYQQREQTTNFFIDTLQNSRKKMQTFKFWKLTWCVSRGPEGGLFHHLQGAHRNDLLCLK